MYFRLHLIHYNEYEQHRSYYVLYSQTIQCWSAQFGLDKVCADMKNVCCLRSTIWRWSWWCSNSGHRSCGFFMFICCLSKNVFEQISRLLVISDCIMLIGHNVIEGNKHQQQITVFKKKYGNPKFQPWYQKVFELVMINIFSNLTKANGAELWSFFLSAP